MTEYDEDDLVHCEESLTSEVISNQPYWNMNADQRAEWKRYTQQKAQLQRVQEQVVEEDEDDYTSASEEEEEDKEEKEEASEEEGEEEEEEQEEPKKIDKRKLWIDYQKISRSELQGELGKKKDPFIRRQRQSTKILENGRPCKGRIITKKYIS